MNDSCNVCHEHINSKTNLAIFDCGHKFHLHCIIKRAGFYATTCPTCTPDQRLNLKPNLGDDRKVSMASTIQARIKRRQMQPKEELGLWARILSVISPFYKTGESGLSELISSGVKLTELKKMGYTSEDCVQDKITWDFMRKNCTTGHLLQFGFKWKDMVAMGIKCDHLNDFTWSQMKHTLNINANELLRLNMNLTELAELGYSPHQLNDLGFNWDIFVSMGANVATLPAFKMTIEDIKTYFNPSMKQWMAAGFYDKSKLTKNGWEVTEVIRLLPDCDYRSDGRQLRLTF